MLIIVVVVVIAGLLVVNSVVGGIFPDVGKGFADATLGIQNKIGKTLGDVGKGIGDFFGGLKGSLATGVKYVGIEREWNLNSEFYGATKGASPEPYTGEIAEAPVAVVPSGYTQEEYESIMKARGERWANRTLPLPD